MAASLGGMHLRKRGTVNNTITISVVVGEVTVHHNYVDSKSGVQFKSSSNPHMKNMPS